MKIEEVIKSVTKIEGEDFKVEDLELNGQKINLHLTNKGGTLTVELGGFIVTIHGEKATFIHNKIKSTAQSVSGKCINHHVTEYLLQDKKGKVYWSEIDPHAYYVSKRSAKQRKQKNIGFDKGEVAPKLKADYFMVDIGDIKVSEDNENDNSCEFDKGE